MSDLLSQYPLLLLFIVASLGYLIGSIKIKGSSLGVAAILFTGLFFGALNADFHIPDIIFQLGLALFIYSLGLSSGPAFFRSYKQNGIRDILFVLSMLIFSGLVAALIFYLFDFSAATITGIYTGSTTNTAALAGVLDYINNSYPSTQAKLLSKEAVVGYTMSYPMGVLGTIIGILFIERLLKINYKNEEVILKKKYPVDQNLTSCTIRITNPKIADITLRDFFKKYDWQAVFGRVVKDRSISLSHYETTFKVGDMVMVVGSEEQLKEIAALLGEFEKSNLSFERQQYDSRRIFVSNPKVAGRTIAELNLNGKFDAVITRIRRGDVDMLATGSTVLELGDRIRFMAKRKDLKQLSKFFGDSYHDSNKVDLFSFGLGIGLGLILGIVEFSFGDGLSFKLGYAGGPLVVGLILGSLRRTGPIVWTLSYGANVTLQQIGLILLLSTIGVQSGSAFIQSLNMEGLEIFAAGAVISITTAVAILVIGYKLLDTPFSLLTGMVSNQPAILDIATSRSGNIIPNFGFTLMMPLALISKIIIAQLLFLLLV